jgi:hypothetical protein
VSAAGVVGFGFGRAAGNINAAPITLGGGIVRAGVLIQTPVLTTPFTDLVFGMTAETLFAVNATGSTGFTLRLNGNVNSSRWQRGIGDNSGSASAMTYVDTGVAGANTTWYLLEMVIAADAKSCEFFINGVSAGTSSSSTAQTRDQVMLQVALSKVTSSGTARTLAADMYYVLADCGARF